MWKPKFLRDFLEWCKDQDATEGDLHLMTQEEWEENQRGLREHLKEVEDRFYRDAAKGLYLGVKE